MSLNRVNHPRKTNRAAYTLEDLNETVDKVLEGRTLRSVAADYGMAFKTLARYVEKRRSISPTKELVVGYSSHRLIFFRQNEIDFVAYLKLRAKMCYGLTRMDVKKAAWDFAKYLEISYPPTWDRDKRAGEEWLKHFRSRHKDLKLKKPEACSLSRATSFNKTNVNLFFENLAEILKRAPELADGLRTYNLDETGLSTVQTPRKVLADSATKRLNKVTSAERGVTVTACCIISASGNYLPPVLVFPRRKIKDHMMKGAPAGSLGLAHSSGWMVTDLFPAVMRHFIKHTNSSLTNPSLLLFDNHESHLGPEANRLAKDNGVHILTIPPHCSDKMQPLDVAVYRSTKTNYNSELDKWMSNHPGKTVTIYDVAELFGAAFHRSMTPSNIVSAFRTTGIVPFNPDVFSEELFLCSLVTDRPNPEEEDGAHEEENDQIEDADDATSAADERAGPSHDFSTSTPTAFTSTPTASSSTPTAFTSTPYTSTVAAANASTASLPSTSGTSSSGSNAAMACFGLPQASPRKIAKGRKRGRSTILTSSPVLAELEQKAAEKAEKEKTKAANKVAREAKKAENEAKKAAKKAEQEAKKAHRKQFQSGPTATAKRGRPKKHTALISSSSDSDDSLTDFLLGLDSEQPRKKAKKEAQKVCRKQLNFGPTAKSNKCAKRGRPRKQTVRAPVPPVLGHRIFFFG